MLGSATDAEDVVQEACIRWLRARTAAGRVGARLSGHDRDPAVPRPTRFGPGPARVPTPARGCPSRVVEDESAAVEQADSLSLAFLVLLEELTPLERATYLLHDVFGYPFEEVARSLGRVARRLPAARRRAPQARRRAPPAFRRRPPARPGADGSLRRRLCARATCRACWPCCPRTSWCGRTAAARSVPPCGRSSARTARSSVLAERRQEGPGMASVRRLERSTGDRVHPGRHRALRVGAGHPRGSHRRACASSATPTNSLG